MAKIYLDAGHGGADSGATGNGLREKDLNLQIVLAINNYLTANYENVETKLTRNTDVFLTLKERTDTANAWGADYFLSIHCNANPNINAQGFSTYTYNNTTGRTKSAQNIIHKAVMAACPEFIDLGQMEADFHVIRESHMPAMLTENGFVSNPADSKKLSDPDFIRRIAEGHCKGLANFFGLIRKGGATMDYETHWAKEQINRVIAEGLMTADNGIFRPDDKMTRAELATVLVRLLDRKAGA